MNSRQALLKHLSMIKHQFESKDFEYSKKALILDYLGRIDRKCQSTPINKPKPKQNV